MSKITLDEVARTPAPGMALPGSFKFSPDGSALTFLFSEEGTLARRLYALDLATGEQRVLFAPEVGVTEQNVSREEALRRERERLMHTGVTHYEWAERAKVLLVPLRGELWMQTGGGARKVGERALDPHLSPDGSKIAFVRDGDLYAIDIATGTERRLTSDAEPGVTNGLAEFVAQEEMGRARGFWWSPDGARISYEHVDERNVPVFRIPHFGSDDPQDVEEHRYPFAGAENARTTLGIVDADGGETCWLDLAGYEYIARVAWHPDGRLFVQLLSRDQRRLELRAFAPDDPAGTVLLREESDLWVNLHDDLRFVEPTGEFVWSSERTGSKQLSLHAADGSLVRALTSGAFPVDSVLQVDEERRRVAYSAATTPVESHLFIVSLDTAETEQLTKESGMHGGVFARDLDRWIEVFHSRAQPPSVTLHGDTDRTLHAPPHIEVDLVTPEIFEFAARDGQTLYGMLTRPARIPAPLVVQVYGGPHAQTVGDSWASTAGMFAQYLVSRGFAVMSVDNRGSARRGLAFEGALCERMGTIEIEDQVDGVGYAQDRGWVDGDRVGMFGWSYGGYMTIMSMLKAPEVFGVGIAGAPVTHWDGYDTCYTERYMRTPQDNPDGYRDGSAMAHAARLEGKLMIVHGMIDENVHFRHTARFLDALQKANRTCELLVYPNERHSPRSEKDRRNMYERMAQFFETNL